MEQYIDKATVVAEIERRKKKNEEWKNSCKGIDSLAASMVIQEDINILSFLDTLEVKETPDSANLEEEIENELERTWYGEYLDTDKFKESAVYFYELGLKAKGE